MSFTLFIVVMKGQSFELFVLGACGPERTEFYYLLNSSFQMEFFAPPPPPPKQPLSQDLGAQMTKMQ